MNRYLFMSGLLCMCVSINADAKGKRKIQSDSTSIIFKAAIKTLSCGPTSLVEGIAFKQDLDHQMKQMIFDTRVTQDKTTASMLYRVTNERVDAELLFGKKNIYNFFMNIQLNLIAHLNVLQGTVWTEGTLLLENSKVSPYKFGSMKFKAVQSSPLDAFQFEDMNREQKPVTFTLKFISNNKDLHYACHAEFEYSLKPN